MTARTNAAAMAMTHEWEPFESLVRIIRAEFNEMPEMWLTRAQFRRFWHLTDPDCDRLLRHFLETGFLTQSGRGVGRPSAR